MGTSATAASPASEPHASGSAVQGLLDRISTTPKLWNSLRWIVEAGFQGEKRVIEQELAPWRAVGQRRFLDFGCGTGELAPCFPASHYVGIDLSTTYLRHAGQAHRGQFVATSGDTLALRSQQFDAALVLGVIHHLPDEVAKAAMTELHRVLRPGAIALVMEDIPPPDPWNVAGHAMHWLDRGGHIRAESDYRAIFGPGFGLRRSYTMRSGICDYGVYVLERQ